MYSFYLIGIEIIYFVFSIVLDFGKIEINIRVFFVRVYRLGKKIDIEI